MEFEHFGINVPDPRAMARWYVTHLGMQIVLGAQEEPFMHFLADAGGRVVIEIYCNPDAPVPDYAKEHPMRFHIAFAEPDPGTTKDRLLQAGASLLNEDIMEDGTHLVMLRDPWGIPLQLCKRATPLG
ncbi:MAG: VOC family protein [Candidatus Latescibacteria bacterium]|nr:VOC family protein [Candidatus Latescibacterota bacterium]MCK5733264.1 VOC family protein [Candidatus Latescibacterota bacterium]